MNLWTVYGWRPSSFGLHEDVLSRLAASGATAVELIVDEEWHTFERTLAAKADLVPALEEQGLAVSGVACRHFFAHNPASVSAEVRGRALRAMRGACRVAREYGADAVVVIPGLQEQNVAYDASYDAAVQTLAHAARYADDDGVTLVVENVAVDFLQSPREFRQLLDDVASPAVRACLDLGNVLAANGRFPENWIRELSARIGLVHAKDYARGEGMRACGQGEVDWETCFAALDEVQYEGPLVVETPPNEGEDVLLEDGLTAADVSVRYLVGVAGRPTDRHGTGVTP